MTKKNKKYFKMGPSTEPSGTPHVNLIDGSQYQTLRYTTHESYRWVPVPNLEVHHMWIFQDGSQYRTLRYTTRESYRWVSVPNLGVHHTWILKMGPSTEPWGTPHVNLKDGSQYWTLRYTTHESSWMGPNTEPWGTPHVNLKDGPQYWTLRYTTHESSWMGPSTEPWGQLRCRFLAWIVSTPHIVCNTIGSMYDYVELLIWFGFISWY